MITIYVFLIALGWKDYSKTRQDLSNLCKKSVSSSFCPVINYWYKQALSKMGDL